MQTLIEFSHKFKLEIEVVQDIFLNCEQDELKTLDYLKVITGEDQEPTETIVVMYWS